MKHENAFTIYRFTKGLLQCYFPQVMGSMKKRSVNEMYINLVRALYSGITSSFKTGCELLEMP